MMDRARLESGLEALSKSIPAKNGRPPPGAWAGEKSYDRVRTSSWTTEASTLIASAFPIGHPIRTQFDEAVARGNGHHFGLNHPQNFEPLIGLIQGALALLRGGLYGSVLDGVRAESIEELLNQAAEFNGQGHVVAATVLAGGALETHLLHLCKRAALPNIPSPGSIDKYKGIMDQERGKGNEIISASDGKSVTAWGGARNDAAHTPIAFTKSKVEVQAMIDGIREFFNRTK